MWKDWIPQERKVIERLVDETIENDIDPGIFDHIVSKKPLPSHTEILDQESGEWRRLNDIELGVANSAGFSQIDGLHWHHSWSSKWAKLRIPKQETA